MTVPFEPMAALHSKSKSKYHDGSRGLFQILMALIHREALALDGEFRGSVKKLAMSNIKRFSHHRGKDEIKQNVKSQSWKDRLQNLRPSQGHSDCRSNNSRQSDQYNQKNGSLCP
jgi:hypothetical protein